MPQPRQIIVFERKLEPIAEQAQTFSITSEQSLKEAVSILSQLNQLNDRIKEEREKVTAPLNQALKVERGRWKPLETRNQTAIDAIRAEMTRYQTELFRHRQSEEQKIADKLTTGKIKKVETAVKHIEALPTVDKNIPTAQGDVQFRETPTLKILDLEKIAREYFDLNEQRLLKDLKSGKLVEGAEIEIMMTPVNYR